MTKVSLAILVSLFAMVDSAYAQEPSVTMSTDPAKVADVEQRAQALQSQQQAMESAPTMPAHHKSALHHKRGHEGGSGSNART
jgi:hypothetical protein